jgi:hypothetical protein
MPDSDESRGEWLWSFAGLAGLLIVCAAIGYYVWARIYITQSLQRADIIELTQTLKRWIEAGQPKGEALTGFMQGRRQDLVVSNRLFTIDGTNYTAQFAVTNPKSQRPGTLFVTTNENLIWLTPAGQPELVPRN